MIVSEVEQQMRERKMSSLQSLTTSSVPSSRVMIYTTPGEVVDGVDATEGFLKGHGTQLSEGDLRATVSGVVERVNKLVSVKALKAKYTPETGDVVVGRINMISSKRWKVDINSRQEAVLQLSSVNLPTGQQRRRNEADELNMSLLFDTADVISAEVQSLFQDGAANLHARSTKYGRLSRGVLVEVCPSLVKRLPQHFHALEVTPGVFIEVLIGCNGFIWVGSPGAATSKQATNEKSKTHEEELILVDKQERENIVRVANCVRALDELFFYVTPQSIMSIYKQSEGMDAKSILMSHAFLAQVIESEIEARTRTDEEKDEGAR
jgi:exosome complex component RRP4